MCGICGFVSYSKRAESGDILAMAEALTHRGPDDSGVWVEDGVGLGHRRLSILELSPLGHQPMFSACGRYVMVYNGEVYNHQSIRNALGQGHSFKGTSDTETILAAISEWGLEKAIGRFVGMFAFALWDRSEKRLYLVRDRVGIKPLFFGLTDEGLVFGSELKALKKHSGFAGNINRNALALYFRHNFIPAPYSIFENVEKVRPGELITVSQSGVERKKYWDIDEVWRGNANSFSGDDQEAIDCLESLLLESVELRMLSDVSLGAFLSGGYDSSIIVALMQRLSSKPVKTFSIGFSDNQFDESHHARSVAQYLGTDHTELTVEPDDLLKVVSSVPRWWDEPFADSSQIPTYILSKLAREKVTVSLSGDGGDELFSGYSRYGITEGVWNKLSKAPFPLRSFVADIGEALPSNIFKMLGLQGSKYRLRMAGIKSRSFEELYFYLVSHFKTPSDLVLNSEEPGSDLSQLPSMADKRAWMSLFDLLGYLPDDILTKVDRASMAVSLEARVPLLDHRVVEFAASLPTSKKIRGRDDKWILRQVLYKYVPQELVDRPKMGFGIPIVQWLRSDLNEWCNDLLNPEILRRQGYLDQEYVSRIWKEFLGGVSGWAYYIWDILMFQLWLEEWDS